MNQSTNQYSLEIHLEHQMPMNIDVVDSISAGLDPRNDLVLLGKKINNRHLVFNKKGENLALHYLGTSDLTFLNSLPLEENKTYILEAGDKIRLNGAEIIVKCELSQSHLNHQTMPVFFESSGPKKLETITDEVISRVSPSTTTISKQMTKQKNIRIKISNTSWTLLWLIKLYSLVVDAFITYVVLVVLLPFLLVDQLAISILSYFSTLIFPSHIHSFFNFFISWYLLSFTQTIIFGTTFGQLILGLRNKSEKTVGGLILFRMKSLIFALFLLPAQNTVKNTLIYKGFRKFGVIILLLFILISPFLLPAPYNTSLALMGNDQSKIKELHTRTIMSYSKKLEMYLSTELSFRYYLLPIITHASKRAFELVDLKSGESIIVSEADEQSYENIEIQLKYGNPLYSTFNKKTLSQVSLKEKKLMIQNILLLSPIRLSLNTKRLGPFFGSGLLVKKSLMNANIENDMVLKAYKPQTPLFYLSSAQQDYFYLLGPLALRRFDVAPISKGHLLTAFEQSIFTNLTQDSQNSQNFLKLNNKDVTILEAQDAFLDGDEQTFLTYYVGIANNLSKHKIIHAEVDFTKQAKIAVIKNIEAVLKFIKNKDVYKSFIDIKNQLAPMEKPGEKR